MKVNEFIEKMSGYDFNGMETDETVKTIADMIEVKPYINIRDKKIVIESVLFDASTYEDGYLKIDSIESDLSFVKYMIRTHTNIEVYTDEDYDNLASFYIDGVSLVDYIFSFFSDDMNTCNRLLQMRINDEMQQNSPLMKMGIMLNKFSVFANEAINNLDFDALTKQLNELKDEENGK